MVLTYSASKQVAVYNDRKELLSVYRRLTVAWDGTITVCNFPTATTGVNEMLDTLGKHVFRIKKVIVNPTTWSQNTESYFTLYVKDETTSSGPSEILQQGDFTQFDLPDIPLQTDSFATTFMTLTHSSAPAASDALTVHMWLEVIA